MKILLACDKFKGSLGAYEVNEAVKTGFSEVFPEAEYVNCIIADGGEGFVRALMNAVGGKLRATVVEDALGRKVSAEWGLIPHGGGAEAAGGAQAAVIEMSAASGLWRIAENERDIMSGSTYGTGQLIKAALATEGVEKIYLGLGGSATNDGGTGMAQALGVQFFEGDRLITERMSPSLLSAVSRIDYSQRIPLVPITVACDVNNPLCGPEGASAIFGPQKGASAEQIPQLDGYLQYLSSLVDDASLSICAGAGAAGGLGFGLMSFAEAQLVSGFDLVADAIQLKVQVESADLVITGEGKLDSQSLAGKGPIGVAKLARDLGKPCLAIAGEMEQSVDWSPYFRDYACLAEMRLPIEDLMENAENYLIKTAGDLARRAL